MSVSVLVEVEGNTSEGAEPLFVAVAQHTNQCLSQKDHGEDEEVVADGGATRGIR